MLRRVIALIGTGYALILVLVLALGLMAASSMDRLQSIASNIYLHPFVVNDATLDAQANIVWMEDNLLDMARSTDPEEIDKLLAESKAREQSVRGKLVLIKARFLGNIETVKEVERLLDDWRTVRSSVAELSRQRQTNRAEALIQDAGIRIFIQMNAHMGYIVSFTRQRAADFVAESENEAKYMIRLTWWLLGGLITAISIIGGGVVYRVYLLVRRQQKLDADLRQYSTKLEATNLELESFSYSISHDLRVPLRAVDGFSRILLDEYKDKLDAEGQRLLNVVRDNTKRMGQLIDDILSFSRSGRIEMTPEKIDMEALVREVMGGLKPDMAGRKVTLEINPLPPAIADRAMMRRVLTNILANAVKFTRPKAAAKIEVGASNGEGETVYYVKDNGVGFDMKYVSKLFGMFLRLHGVEEFEGTGIGLAIVKRIITRHGGRVWADARVNEGATIYFALPAIGKHEAQAKENYHG